MNCSIAVLGGLIMLLLAGCSQGTPTPIPSKTPTQSIFIRVPTPSAFKSPTTQPTLVPTVVISGTVVVFTPTETPTSTPTPTPTPTPVTVTELPNPSGYAWQEVVNGLDHPEGLVNSGDDSGRLFILEQAGRIRILKDGAVLPTPFLDLTQKVDCCGEKGLLGLVFHPKYSAKMASSM